MKAVVIRAFGEPDVLRLETMADPSPGPGEVLVEVEYAGVTFVETQVRAGWPPHPAMTPELPVVLGNGVAGRVVRAGAGVADGLLGRSVVSTTGGRGGYAELAAVDAGLPIVVPDGLPARDAVALLADGRTALALVEAARVAPGETVFVAAAAGGVGTCLTQLSRTAGATVVAGVGSAGKLAVADRLGAAASVDYSQEDWSTGVRRAFGAVDVVFDGIGGTIGTDAFALVAPGGRHCRYGMASGAYTSGTRPDVAIIEGLALTPERSRQLSIEALELAAAGRLQATIGQEHPLEDAAAAHRAIEARSTVGKTLLRAPRAQSAPRNVRR